MSDSKDPLKKEGGITASLDRALEIAGLVNPAAKIANYIRERAADREQRRIETLTNALAAGLQPGQLPEMLEIPANAETFDSVYVALVTDEEDSKAGIYSELMLSYLRNKEAKAFRRVFIVKTIKALSFSALQYLKEIAEIQTEASIVSIDRENSYDLFMSKVTSRTIPVMERWLHATFENLASASVLEQKQLATQACLDEVEPKERLPYGFKLPLVTWVGDEIVKLVGGALVSPK